eukprot:38517_1
MAVLLRSTFRPCATALGISWTILLIVLSIVNDPDTADSETLPAPRQDDIASNIIAQSHTDSPSCLVIIWGLTRAWQLTYQSVSEHLLDPFQCDLALSVGNTDENTTNPFYQRAKFIWTHDFDEIGYETAIQRYYLDLIPDNNSYTKWFNKYMQMKYDNNLTQLMGPLWTAKGIASRGSSGIGIVTRYFTALNLLKHNLVDTYELLVYTRSDFKYMCRHHWKPFMDKNDILWVPNGMDYKGIYDRHFVASPRTFIKVNSLLRRMILDEQYFEMMNASNMTNRNRNGPKRRLSSKKRQKTVRYIRKRRVRRKKRHKKVTRPPKRCKTNVKRWNSEQMLALHIQTSNITIKRYEPSMYLVRDNATWTRWQTGVFNAKDRVYVKYENEYANTLKYCVNQSYVYSKVYLRRRERSNRSCTVLKRRT